MTADEKFMVRCFELAKRGAGQVSPNPVVGAVLVYGDRLIGEGWHQTWGQAHAEINCFNSVAAEDQDYIKKSTLYCNLEPCAHFGKTPPCSDLIVRQKVARVVIANTDPNPLVAGRGIQKLREAGIEVTEAILDLEGKWLNRGFFGWITSKKPFVTLKWAESADGFLGRPGERTPISDAPALRLLHRWRAETDAILVGAGTAKTDDPRLDVRHFFGKNPMRVLLDGSGTVPADRHLLSDEHPTLIFGPERSDLAAHKTIFLVTREISIPAFLDVLQKQNLAILLVEGGAQVITRFLDGCYWNEIRIIKNSRPLGYGLKAPHVPAGAILRENYRIGNDEIFIFSPASRLHS